MGGIEAAMMVGAPTLCSVFTHDHTQFAGTP